jgi:uncharacterized protein (TIGR00730 family)
MAAVRRLCVYCGSHAEVAEAYRAAARALGAALAGRGIELVYGGGRVGLMGLCAEAALAGGGAVTGIIPGHLHEREVGHHGLTRLLVTESMHERKRLMFEMSDAFLVLPGGLGTLDETFEIITWNQLGIVAMPVVFVDVGGYFTSLFDFIESSVDAEFVSPANARLAQRAPTVELALDLALGAPVPYAPKWIG